MLTSALSSFWMLTSAYCKWITCAEVNEIFRNLCRSSPVPKFGYPLYGQQTSADSTVRVMSLSRLSSDFPKNPVRCLSAVHIFCQVPVCSDFVRKCVRNSRKKQSVVCLSGRTRTRQRSVCPDFWYDCLPTTNGHWPPVFSISLIYSEQNLSDNLTLVLILCRRLSISSEWNFE